MAVSRYDQRKNYEEAEANAIGTEYVRADMLSVGDAAKIRELLKRYVDQRVLFYTTRNNKRLAKIDPDTVEQVCPDFCVNDQVLFLGMGSGEGVQFPFPSPSL